MNKIKKAISILMTVALLVAAIPTAAFAAGSEVLYDVLLQPAVGGYLNYNTYGDVAIVRENVYYVPSTGRTYTQNPGGEEWIWTPARLVKYTSSGVKYISDYYVSISDFSDDGYAVATTLNSSGIIDSSGKTIVQFGTYEYIYNISEDGNVVVRKKDNTMALLNVKTNTETAIAQAFATYFSSGYTLVGKQSETVQSYAYEYEFEFQNPSGENVFNKQFQYAQAFSNGYAIVKTVGSYVYEIIDAKGQTVLTVPSDYRPLSIGDDGIVTLFDNNGKTGYMDVTGKWIAQCQYDGGRAFKNGFAVVYSTDGWGLIGKNGKIIIPFGEFSGLSDVSNTNLVWANSSGGTVLRVRQADGPETPSAKQITQDMFTVNVDPVTYDGNAKTKTIISNLTLDRDYTVAYADNVNAGTATITITGKGLYTGTLTYTFTINRAPAMHLTATVYMNLNEGYTKTLDLAKLTGWHSDMGGSPVIALQQQELTGLESADLQGTVLTLTSDGEAQDEDTLTVTVNVTGMTNYEDSTVAVTVKFLDELLVEITDVAVEDKVYDGNPAAYEGEAVVIEEASGETVELPEGGLIYQWQIAPTDDAYVMDPDAVSIGIVDYDPATVNSAYAVNLDTAPTKVGNYRLVISVADNLQYTGSKVFLFAISKAPLTVAPADVTIYAGDALPDTFELVYSGFVSGEGPDVLTWTVEPAFVLMDGGQALENSGRTGTYQIVWAGGAVESENYDITLLPGTLRVINRPAPPPPPTPTVSGGRAENGSVKLSSSTASVGTKVTVTVTPDAGYKVESVVVTDRNGDEVEVTKNEDGTYTFTVPAATPVTVTAKFSHICAHDTLSDVDVNQFYHEAVDYMVLNGFIDGYPEGVFKPNAVATRGQMLTIMAAANGVETESDPWYKASVDWAVAAGYSDGTRPTAPIQREEIVTILWQIAKKPASEQTLEGYEDAGSVNEWAKAAMAWAVENGIIKGRAEDRLVPQGTATRAELAQMLYNYFNLAK